MGTADVGDAPSGSPSSAPGSEHLQRDPAAEELDSCVADDVPVPLPEHVERDAVAVLEGDVEGGTALAQALDPGHLDGFEPELLDLGPRDVDHRPATVHRILSGPELDGIESEDVDERA